MRKITPGSLFVPLKWVMPTDAEVSRMGSPPKLGDHAYLIFPDFGHWLFKYIKQEDNVGTFIDFYREKYWRVSMVKEVVNR